MRWASFAITRARYDVSRTQLGKVGIREVKTGRIGPEIVWPRDNIVELVERGFTFVTASNDGSGRPRREGTVGLVRMDGETYLRVDGESISRDDLGKLPEF